MAATEVDTVSGRQEFGGSEFRNTVGSFATGVTVITTRGRDDVDDDVYGMTANAFSSVSLDPPLVLICVISGTTGAETIERNGVFAVNVLGSHQEPISRFFSSRDRPIGQAAFAEFRTSTQLPGRRFSNDRLRISTVASPPDTKRAII